jgi:hypothetical protein
MTEPKLDKPGAGLPFHEYLIGRYILMPFTYATTSWEKAQRLFAEETNKITRLYKRIPVEARSQKVLIDRITGIEDSSRYWSADMVLEHLMIVTEALAETIEKLDREITPDYQGDTARVKPIGHVQGDVLAQFTDIMDKAYNKMHAIRNRDSKARFKHPWFGWLNSRELHVFLPLHQCIHRKQLERILDGLETGRKS